MSEFHVVLGLSDADNDTVMDAATESVWSDGDIDWRLNPWWHSHPSLGISGHGHGTVEESRTPHIHRRKPEPDWDMKPLAWPPPEVGQSASQGMIWVPLFAAGDEEPVITGRRIHVGDAEEYQVRGYPLWLPAVEYNEDRTAVRLGVPREGTPEEWFAEMTEAERDGLAVFPVTAPTGMTIEHIAVVQGGGLPTLHFDPAEPVSSVVNARGETYAEVVARTDAIRAGRLSESGRTENWWTAEGLRICCPACQDREHDACYGPDFGCECGERDHFGYFQSPEWLEDE